MTIRRPAPAAATAALLLLAATSAARADEPKRGGEIKVATYGDPATLDPHVWLAR